MPANNWGVGRFSRGCRSLCFLLKRGRSAPFANPALTALQAHYVWLPEVGTSAFPAVAKPVEASTAGDASVFVPALPCLEHILVDARGRQHVVLRANGAALQLMVEGADVATGPVAITFLVRGLGAIREAADHLATLRRILSPTSRLPALPRWTATTRKLRDALVALDGRAAGASYYEVAIVLYGIEYVERTWRTGLKGRMRHHLRRGLALSRGGYRHLLR
jgi:hypothetical protein